MANTPINDKGTNSADADATIARPAAADTVVRSDDATRIAPSPQANLKTSAASDRTQQRTEDTTHVRPETDIVDADEATRIAPKPESVNDADKTRIKSPEEKAADVTRVINSGERQFAAGDSTQTLNPLTKTYHKPFAQGGDVINKRFIIEKVLGQGGMGMVCKALDLRKVEADDQQPYVAIKLLSSDFAEHPHAFKSLQREAKKSQALAHPNIITVYDFDRDDSTVYMTMELLDGVPLDNLIKGFTPIQLTFKEKLKCIREIGQALAYAHSKGIIHSDLKPANIFYTSSGQIKVLDFGIARALNDAVYKDNYDAGELNAITPKYASLEMFEQEDPAPSDDIYALGLIAGELLSGKHPYNGAYATAVNEKNLKPEQDKALSFLYKNVVADAVAIKRKDRIQTAAKFLNRLQWAEKGPQRFAIASVFAALLIIANWIYIDAVDPDIPLSDLPLATQQEVTKNIAEADTALSFKDYDGAIVYLERAYDLHPSNHDVEDRINAIIKTITANIKTTTDAEEKHFLIEELKGLGNYDAIGHNENYIEMMKEL